MFRYIVFGILLISSLSYSQMSTAVPAALDSAGTHTLFITSDPSGASVYIADSSCGKTPLRLENFSKKPFLLKLVDSLQNNWGLVIRDIKSKQVNVHALIAKPYGELQVFSDPMGAEVFVNDSLVGKTPLDPIKIPLGFTKVKLKKENYVTYEEVVNIPKMISYLYQIDAKLKSVYSALDISALSSYSHVYLDGKAISFGNENIKRIRAGEHNVRINMPKEEPDLNIDFEAANDTCYSVYLRPKQFNFKPILLSLVIPGLGQVYDGSILKGSCIITGVMALAVAGYLTSDNYSKKVDQYDKQRLIYLSSNNEFDALVNKDIMFAAKDKMDKALKTKQIAIGLLAGTYLYNVLDVLLFHSSKDMLDVKRTTSGINLSSSTDLKMDGFSLGMNINF